MRRSTIHRPRITGRQQTPPAGADPRPVPTPPAGQPPANDADGAPAPRTFTQEEVTAMVAREKVQGRNSVLSRLGFDTPEAAEAFVTAQREAERQAMSEADRKAAEAEEAKAQAAKDKATAAAATREAALTVALATAGSVGVNLEDARALLAAKVGAEATAEQITTEVEALRTRRPELFTAPVTPAATPPAGSRLAGVPGAGRPPGGAQGQRGAAEAARRYPQTAGK